MSQPITFKARLKHYAMEADDWAAENPELLTAERGYQLPNEDYPNGRWKTGPGNWNALPYDDDPEVALPTSTPVGRALITAEDAAAGRIALGAVGVDEFSTLTADGATTAAEISAWLASPALGVHRLQGSATISEPIIIPSNTTLDATGATITLSAAADCNLVQNQNAVTPQRSVADAAVTAGSATVTSATAAFTVADVGRTLVVDGASGGGEGPLVGIITAVTNATTVVLDSPAADTVSGAAAKVFIRDTNITVRGGGWDRVANGGSGNNKHGLFFRHVDNLDVDIEKFSSSGPSKYAISAGDLRWYRLSMRDADTTSDGVHVTGPAFHGDIPYVSGKTGDDLLAFTAGDYPDYGDVGGDIVGVSIGTVFARGSMRALKVVAGAGRLLDSMKVYGLIQGDVTNDPIWIGDGYGYVTTVGGVYGTIDCGFIDAVSSGGYPDLYLVSPTAERITAKIKHRATSTATASVSIAGATASTIGDLILDDCDWAGASLVAAIAVSGAPVTVKRLTINRSRHTGASSLFAITAGTVNDLVARDGEWNCTGVNGAFFMNGGTVGNLSIMDCKGVYVSTNRVVQLNSGTIGAVTFSRGKHSAAGALFRNISGTVNTILTLDQVHALSVSRIAQVIGSLTAVLIQPLLDTVTNAAFYVTTGPLLIQGSARINGTFTLSQRAAAESIRVIGQGLPQDVAILSKTAGDTATNTNGSLGCDQ